MSRKKTAAELQAEYERAEARAQQLREQMKRATAAEEAAKRAQLVTLVLRWGETYKGGIYKDIDDLIGLFEEWTARAEAKAHSEDSE